MVSPARGEAGSVAAAGHWGTGLGFSDLELCAQQLYFPLQAYFFSFIKKKKADLCTQLVLIFQVEKIGLVHGKYSGDISFICCFKLSLNFWTVLIDFFFLFLLLEKPSQVFSCL